MFMKSITIYLRSFYEGNLCIGVDANRNYGWHFNDGGATDDSCSDLYHGPDAWSEVENANIRDFIMAKKDNFMFFNSLHSYSQFILIPWGYTKEPTPNYDDMFALASKVRQIELYNYYTLNLHILILDTLGK